MMQTTKETSKKVYAQPSLEKHESLVEVTEGDPINLTSGIRT
jgi:hypothetical protein